MKRNQKLNFINILICLFIFILSVFYYNYFIIFKLPNHNYNQENNRLGIQNKIIVIGDSRMRAIKDIKEELKIPKNVIFIAKSGARIDWLYDEATTDLREILKEKDNYRYHVVFNLGVNDLDEEINPNYIAEEYYDYYSKIIESNKDVSFYFLSVNPVDENRIYKYFSMYNRRTNNKIKKFNNYFINRLNNEKISNTSYCDSYNELDFYLPDGLHYDTDTNKKIVKYIIEKCIKY